MKVDIENHNLSDLVLEMRYADVMNVVETLPDLAHHGQRPRLRC